jgi:hypothetical protein
MAPFMLSKHITKKLKTHLAAPAANTSNTSEYDFYDVKDLPTKCRMQHAHAFSPSVRHAAALLVPGPQKLAQKLPLETQCSIALDVSQLLKQLEPTDDYDGLNVIHEIGAMSAAQLKAMRQASYLCKKDAQWLHWQEEIIPILLKPYLSYLNILCAHPLLFYRVHVKVSTRLRKSHV